MFYNKVDWSETLLRKPTNELINLPDEFFYLGLQFVKLVANSLNQIRSIITQAF